MVGYDLIHFSIIENVLICYFVGMVNSRLGSLVLERFLLKVRFIKYAPHDEYAKAEKSDAKITALTEENNMFRSLANAMLILLLAYGAKNISVVENFVVNNFKWIAIVALLIIYICSFKKQTKYIKKRVDENKDK
jgi:hypothetical protein